MKYLVVGPAWVGDMIMAQSLFKFIKQQDSNAIIDVMAPKSTLDLLLLMPEVRQSIPIDLGHGQFNLCTRYQLGKKLRAEKYDQAIITPNSLKSALMPFFAKIPRRTGWLGEQRYILLNDSRRLNKLKYPLMIQRFAALALEKNAPLPEKLPFPKFSVNAQKVATTVAKLDLVLTGKPILALCPGAEFGPAKRWPPEYYAEVAKQKLKEGWDVWLFGSPKESEAAIVVQEATGYACVDLVGKTKLLQAIDLMSLTAAVICNDSGLMHVAAALDKPLVVLYGSSSPKFTPPLSDQVKILTLALDCSPCFKRECPLGHLNCLNKLMPDLALQALEELLHE